MLTIKSVATFTITIVYFLGEGTFVHPGDVCEVSSGIALFQASVVYQKPDQKAGNRALKAKHVSKGQETLESQLALLNTGISQVVSMISEFNETSFRMQPLFAKHSDDISKALSKVKKAVGTYYASDKRAKPAVVNWGTSLVDKVNDTLRAADNTINEAFVALSAKSSGLIGKIRRSAGSVTETLSLAQEAADMASEGTVDAPEFLNENRNPNAKESSASLLSMRARNLANSALPLQSQMDRSVEQKGGDKDEQCSKARARVNTANKQVSSLGIEVAHLNTSLPDLVNDTMDTAKLALFKIEAKISREIEVETKSSAIPEGILEALTQLQSKLKYVPADLVTIANVARDSNRINAKTSVAMKPIEKLPGYVEVMQQHIKRACLKKSVK